MVRLVKSTAIEMVGSILSGPSISPISLGQLATPSSSGPSFLILHKKLRQSKPNEFGELLDIFWVSILQERECRAAGREFAEREREETKESRREAERIRADIREEKRVRREVDRVEARLQRDEDRKGLTVFIQMMAMMATKGRTRTGNDQCGLTQLMFYS